MIWPESYAGIRREFPVVAEIDDVPGAFAAPALATDRLGMRRQ